MEVVLSHAGIQYTHQIAFALDQIGVLKKFYGPFCYHEQSRFVKTLELFSQAPLIKAVLKRLEKHGRSRLNIEKIDMNPWPEMVTRFSRFSFGRNYFTNNVLQHYQNRWFDYSVSKKLERLNFDVFIGLSGSALYSLRQAKRLGKITVVDQHDIHYQLATRLLAEELKACPELKETIFYWPPYEPYLEVLRQEMELADFILVPSTFSLDSHLEAGIPREKLVLMLHATEPECEVLDGHFLSRRSTFRVLSVGTLTQRKGIKYLLEAVKQLNQPDMELTLVGDLSGGSDLLEAYKPYFKWVGFVPHEELKQYFKQADVVVLPTIYDAFGLSALEAMASGVPVIVSENCAAGSDIVRDGVDGFVIPIRNVEVLKDRLLRLYHNQELKEIMGQNAAMRAKAFSWQSYVNELRAFLGSIQRLKEEQKEERYESKNI